MPEQGNDQKLGWKQQHERLMRNKSSNDEEFKQMLWVEPFTNWTRQWQSVNYFKLIQAASEGCSLYQAACLELKSLTTQTLVCKKRINDRIEGIQELTS